jgi:hypothetical protein
MNSAENWTRNDLWAAPQSPESVEQSTACQRTGASVSSTWLVFPRFVKSRINARIRRNRYWLFMFQ